MTSEIFTRIDIASEPASVPTAAESETKDRAADIPDVRTTADLPMLPEFRDRPQSLDWRTALSTAGLAAFLAAVAGIGCGAKATMRKPSPAIPVAGPTSTLTASAGRNLGPVSR